MRNAVAGPGSSAVWLAIRRRLNKKAIPAWLVLLLSVARGLWEVLGQISQVEWVINLIGFVVPYLSGATGLLWSYGWLLGLPIGFIWLKKVDQEPPSKFSQAQMEMREQVTHVLPRLDYREIEILKRLSGGPSHFSRDNFWLALNRDLVRHSIVIEVAEVGGDKVFKLNPLFGDIIEQVLWPEAQ